jgi:hypothetical protein
MSFFMFLNVRLIWSLAPIEASILRCHCDADSNRQKQSAQILQKAGIAFIKMPVRFAANYFLINGNETVNVVPC